jgi:cobyrinic acid a,c-diamide synthase
VSIPRLVIGGATSGAGKTTIVTGIIAALRRRGLTVQPFKCGPDYIDPSYHTIAAGRPCRNLDTWMLSRDVMLESFDRATAGLDIAIIEGVMGLYDGRSGQGETGSTAEIAKILDAPVILVIDAGKTARSAGAMVLGYQQFDPAVRLAGVILNRIGSRTHLESARESIQNATGIPVVGFLPKDSGITLPERHLGLVPAVESEEFVIAIDKIGRQVEDTIDLEAVRRLASSAGPLPAAVRTGLYPEGAQPKKVRIAVARDAAFNFYYEDTLDLLEAWGAELVFVSPLVDPSLPSGIDGVYIGGGFPEMFAEQLATNEPFRLSVANAAAGGLPIYAECGGLMYISEGIVDQEGRRFPMCRIFPGWSVMQKRSVRMGYVAVEALQDSVIAMKGTTLRGHEFHWSIFDGDLPNPAYTRLSPAEGPEGIIAGPQSNVLGSYLHLHFGTDKSLAPRFIESCVQNRP